MFTHLRIIVAVIMVAAASPALAQMSRGECAALVPTVLQSVKDMSAVLERLNQPLRLRNVNQVSDADAESDLEQARLSLLEPFRKYRNAYQDLAFQLQRCAR